MCVCWCIGGPGAEKEEGFINLQHLLPTHQQTKILYQKVALLKKNGKSGVSWKYVQMCLFQMESNFWNLCSLTVIQIILNYIEEFVNFKHSSNSNLLALTSTRPEVLINKEKKPMKPSILNSEAQN